MDFYGFYGGAKFVSPSDAACTAPWICSEFDADKSVGADIVICGLGVFELYINGKKVSDDMLVPACSLYERRENKNSGAVPGEEYSYTVYSMKYDVSEYIVSGKNTLCVLLGRGWYNIPGNYDERCDIFGNVKLCFRLCGKNGKLILQSDENLKWKSSHILKNDLYFGEEHDYRLYNTDFLTNSALYGEYENVVAADAPIAEYEIQTCPADKIIRTIKPKLIHDFGDMKIYDNGENITGFVKMSAAPLNEKVELEHTEEIDAEGKLDGTSFHSFRRPQKDVFIGDGKTEMVDRFCFHGFRYFSVCGNSEPVETLVIHSDVDLTSGFECDNETLNTLFSVFVRTQLDNMHMGVPSDCPTREKLGYTGDGQLLCDAVMTMFDAKEFYRKWIRDLADSQDIITGHVGHTAPVQGGGGGIGGWGSAIIQVPYMFWKHYGEFDIVKKYLPNMIRFIDYMNSRCECGIITGETKGMWCLGDWGFPDESSKELLPQNYVNTYFYVKCLNRMAEICKKAGLPVLAKNYLERAEQSKKVMKAAYMSPMSDNFCANVAGANFFAMDLGLDSPLTVKNTVEKYSKSLAFDTGIFATDLLVKLLFERGYGNLAYKMLSSHTEKYSFGYMFDCGATTLWEYMTGKASHNHPMFGACVKHMFTYLAGIKYKDENDGVNFEISPFLPDEMKHCSAFVTTRYGKVSVSWEKKGQKAEFTAEIPDGASAVFRYGENEYTLAAGTNNICVDL